VLNDKWRTTMSTFDLRNRTSILVHSIKIHRRSIVHLLFIEHAVCVYDENDESAREEWMSMTLKCIKGNPYMLVSMRHICVCVCLTGEVFPFDDRIFWLQTMTNVNKIKVKIDPPLIMYNKCQEKRTKSIDDDPEISFRARINMEHVSIYSFIQK
jgi:hypothetical protein